MFYRHLSISALLLFSVLFCGCGGISLGQTRITYHHSNKEKDSFWMTVSKGSVDKNDITTSLWYCQSRDKAVCSQVQLTKCAKAEDCQMESSFITQDFIETPAIGGYVQVY
ncbi:MAG TPA: hypothetical protein PKH54_09430 [Myxococcota bacterium]|nr:hypothetical protein [Myxococcota bacterium]